MAGATSPATAAAAPPAMDTAAAAPAGGSGSGSGNVGTGTQFITGACTSDADCASGCCVSSNPLSLHASELARLSFSRSRSRRRRIPILLSYIAIDTHHIIITCQTHNRKQS
jgi:hypothetical protein